VGPKSQGSPQTGKRASFTAVAAGLAKAGHLNEVGLYHNVVAAHDPVSPSVGPCFLELSACLLRVRLFPLCDAWPG
jgi:hypothetical protein